MRKLILLILILIPTYGWSATYYVCQSDSGDGDGTSYANCESVASFNGGSFGELDSDTVYLCGTITSKVDPPDGGANDGTRVIISGTCPDHAGIISGVDLAATGSDGALNASTPWTTIQDLTIQNTVGNNDAYGIYLNAQGVTIDNCEISGNQNSGIIVFTGASDWIIEDSYIHENLTQGTIVTGTAANGIIRRNTYDQNGLTENASLCTSEDTSKSFSHNIYFDYQVTGESLIYENILSNAACGQGIKMKASAKMYNNLIYGSEERGIMHVEYAGVTATQYAYNNVFYNNGIAGIGYFKEGEGTLTIYDYNNSIYASTYWHGWGGGIVLGGGIVDSFTAKNNAIYAPSDKYCIRINESSIPAVSDIDYNWCYGPSSDPVVYDGTARTWSYWQETLGFDTNGGNTTPGFTNPPTNLSLVEGANVIDQGVDLGDTYTNGLNPNASWPLSVSTFNQDSYGTGWEIGAYVYPTGEVEPGRVGTIAGDGSGSIPGGGSGSIVGSIIE